jgi:uncharacterized coiled-coil protein SlyX
MLDLIQIKEKLTELQNKETRTKERLSLIQEQLEKQFGTNDVEELNKMLAEKQQQAEEISEKINADMEELNKVLGTCDV